MILVADSGSTKTDWFLSNGSNINQRLDSRGLNPTFLSKAQIEEVVKATFLNCKTDEVTKVFFYGAGCSSTGEVSRVQDALKSVFKLANNYVSHDIEGSAIATCGNQQGIACILGTGSNVCLWDGHRVLPQIPVFGMGYILGDDGSGSHIGKSIIRRFLYNDLPQDLRDEMINLGLNKANIVENVYGKPDANIYLASFAKLVLHHIAHPAMQKIVEDCFHEFFETHITKYENYQTIPVNFVGSVAFVFEKQLRKVGNTFGVKIETIIKNPIDNLMQFHLKQ